MPIDASIYNALSQPRKTALDYADEFQQRGTQRQLNALQLQSANIQNQSALQAQQDDLNLRKYFDSGVDLNTPEGQAGLYKVAPTKAGAILKDRLGMVKDQAAIAKDKAETEAKQYDLTRKKYEHGIMSVVNGATPEAIKASVSEGVIRGIYSMQEAQQILSDLPTDPSQLQRWKMAQLTALLPAKDTLDQEWKAKEFGLKSANDIMTPDGKGGYMPNQPYIEAKKQVAKSGASNVSVKVDAKLGEGVAKEVGPMMRESYESANGAQQQIGTADALIKAVDSGKVMAGPGANIRMFIAQIGQTLGIGGKDAAEQIANTRSAIQGLAQSTVAARASLKGQGQVSDYEGRLLQRAASGEIDSLTAPEIKQIALVNKRLAQQQIKIHNARVGKLQSDPTTAPLANFYESIPLPEVGQVDLGGGFKLKGQ